MSTKEKKAYEMPGLTVVTFKTERGYALSGVGDSKGGSSVYDMQDNAVEDAPSFFSGNRFFRD